VTFDAIVVGSGPAGSSAATALVERGRSVLMLDVGETETRYAPLIPPASFRELRESDASQHRYFLGDDFEGVPVGPVRVGAQLTPPRLYAARSALDALAPVASDTFSAAESLAFGGLGNAWGAGVFPFDDSELKGWPIGEESLRPHYEAVAKRIGISGADDDLSRFFGQAADLMPPLDPDSNATAVLDRYAAVRGSLNGKGFFLGRPRLAVCTERLGDRGPHAYRDMEFWADTDRSVYRPRWTVEALRDSGRLRYADRHLVVRFREEESGVQVETRHVDTGERVTFHGRVLLLGAGTLGTARIVLRSLERLGERVPLLCNPYTYVPVLNLAMLGRRSRDRRHSLAQLTAVYAPRGSSRGAVQVQYYTYRSLLTFKLLKEAPLAHREALRIMRLLGPAFGILGINHDDRPTPLKYCALQETEGGAGRLEIQYALGDDEEARINSDERVVLRCFRRLRCVPIRRIRPGHGSSIHYAGTFPMDGSQRPLTCDADGRLQETRSVHLVDGSPFPYLPAKGLTFTIMANADRVGALLAARLG
jgi:hypothetical protein